MLSDLRFHEWALRGSNPRPPACKAGALPAELNARGPDRVGQFGARAARSTGLRRARPRTRSSAGRSAGTAAARRAAAEARGLRDARRRRRGTVGARRRPRTRSEGASRAVTNKTGVATRSRCRRCKTSMPSISGIAMSSTTRSGRVEEIFASASRPSPATSTSNPTNRKPSDTRSVMYSSSSTTRIRTPCGSIVNRM
jgi:hypothetical protein